MQPSSSRTQPSESAPSTVVERVYLSDCITVLFFACSVGMNFSAHNLISPYLLQKVFVARRVWLKTNTKGYNRHRYETTYEPGRLMLISALFLLAINVILACLAAIVSLGTPHVSFVASVDCEGSDVCHGAMVRADRLVSALLGGWSIVGLITSCLVCIATGLCRFEVHRYKRRVRDRRRLVGQAQEEFVQRIGFTPRSATELVERIRDAPEERLTRIRAAVYQMEHGAAATTTQPTQEGVVNGVPVQFGF